MPEQKLFQARIALIQAFLRKCDYDGILLSRADNFAMATGGKRNFVSIASDMGAASLFVTRDGKTYFVGNNIERTRVIAEELGAFGCEIRDFFWFDGAAATTVKREFSGTLVSDDGSLGENVNGKLTYLRSLLTLDEIEKYRVLGRRAAESITAVLETIRQGDTEAEIAARLIAEGARRQCYVPVALIAADERIARHRHPLPSFSPLLAPGEGEKPVKGYVMVVGGFLKEGLVVSMTRFKRVGELPKGVEDSHERICAVEAIAQENTQRGKTLGDAFAACQSAYATFGFNANEWRNHHQGGATGYAGRTCKGAPGETFPILDPQWEKIAGGILGEELTLGQAFAWNPSAPGVKSEDTFTLLPDGAQEIVSKTPNLPEVNLERLLGRKTSVIKSGYAF
jgi:Xaa-Pro aminopeptidase